MRPLNRSTVTAPRRPVRILQFGGGNFLRAFVDQMVQQANEAGVLDAGIAVVHAVPQPDRAIELLREQDGLYHVLLEGVRGGAPVREFTLVTSVSQVIEAHADFEAYRQAYLSADLEVIVSNTTEAGIAWVPGDDLAAQPPASFPAKMAALLHDRFTHFGPGPQGGLHVVACELIENNATTLREYVLRHAATAGWDDGFAEWLDAYVPFHDTLVDRIVPGYPRQEIDAIQAELGFADQLVVKGEYFGIWAIGGDASLAQVLPLRQAGAPVEFMADVRPFRNEKVRILNGAHTALTAVGLLLGCSTVYEAYGRDDLREFIDALVVDEVLPTLERDPAELRAFADVILERFTNPYLEHRLGDISLNAVAKYGARNLPVALDAWVAGRTAPRTVFALAALLLCYAPTGPGAAIEPRDDAAVIETLRAGLLDAEGDLVDRVRAAIVGVGYLGAQDPRLDRLVTEVAEQIDAIAVLGAEQAMKELAQD